MAFINIATTVSSPKPQKSGTTTISVAVPTPPTSPPPTPRTISELITLRAHQLPEHAILGYPKSKDGIDYAVYTFGQLNAFADGGASHFATKTSLSEALRKTSSEDERVVAILGPSTLEYFVTVLALTRLGFTVLFLSTRISEAAYVSLLNATQCRHIVIDQSFQKTMTKIRSQHITNLEILSILERNEYDNKQASTTYLPEQALNPVVESTKISWIIHSSGSTGLPKPIFQTHAAALRNYENNMNMAGFITLPLFHAHGISSVLRGLTSNKAIFMYNAHLPLTSQNLLSIMQQYKFEIFYGVPYALKLLSESDDGICELAKLKVVMFGGSACPDALGDHLVQGGVNLISHYGTTETGQLMTSFRPVGDLAWNYVRVHDKLAPFVRFEERGGNLFELVVLEGWPSKVATNRDDGAYATKDLFEPHPTIDGAWKYGGRLDDTLVLMNGEKAIPLAMEGAVRQRRVVKDAVIFGSGKSRLGMMVVASESAKDMTEREIVGAIWNTIEKENQNSPAYAHLAPETIAVLPTGTVYPQTDKGTLIRQAFYKAFSAEIEDVYTRLEAAADGTLVLDGAELCAWLKTELLKLISGISESDFTYSTDLFSLGVDSLQSTRLRGVILQELQLNGNPLSQNFVFENPTIEKLAESIVAAREGSTKIQRDVKQEMADLVEKYGKFPQHAPQTRQTNESCVVVTGATGSLGAHVVAQLVKRSDVTEVCCLVRASSEINAMQRVIKSLRERGVYHSLPLAARRKITAYPSNFADSKLKLADTIYQRLTKNITSLIHCAWSVNFNKQLSSFEADCIAGAKNLMALCLATQSPAPASFNFCSSVSTVAATPGEIVPEALPESFACAQGMGYAQSKLVTEYLIAKVARDTGMHARVLRVGQIVADTVQGMWNDTEAIPLMLQAATTIGALPTLDESPRWLPVDLVASSVMDTSLSSTSQTFFNIVNPVTFHWTRDLLPKLREAGLSFEEVGQQEWVKRLRMSNPDVTVNPTFKLVEFFASKYDNDIVKRKNLAYKTSAAEHVSSALASHPQLTQELVTKFVKHFLATSWSPKSKDIPVPKTRLIVLAGPCGCGKSTIASLLADQLNCPTIEGDGVHDAIAITKMSTGVPLSPLDREIWLSRLRIQVLERVRAKQILIASKPSISTSNTIVLTCSALKQEHRNSLRHMLSDGSIETVFVTLQASEEELVRRVNARRGHYMKSNMVASQMAAIEQASSTEVDVLPVNTEGRKLEEVVAEIVGVLEP